MSEYPSFGRRVERKVEDSRRQQLDRDESRRRARQIDDQKRQEKDEVIRLVQEQGGGFLPEQIWGEDSEEALVSQEFLEFMKSRNSPLEVCVYSRNRIVPFTGTPPLRRKKGIFGYEIGFIDPQQRISSMYDRGLSRERVFLCDNGTVRTYGPDPEAIFTPVIGHYVNSYTQHSGWGDGKHYDGSWTEEISTFVFESLTDRLTTIAAQSSAR